MGRVGQLFSRNPDYFWLYGGQRVRVTSLAFVSLHWVGCEAFDDSARRAALRVFWVGERGWYVVSVSVRETL